MQEQSVGSFLHRALLEGARALIAAAAILVSVLITRTIAVAIRSSVLLAAWVSISMGYVRVYVRIFVLKRVPLTTAGKFIMTGMKGRAVRFIPVWTRAPTILCTGAVGIGAEPRGAVCAESESALGRTELVATLPVSTAIAVMIAGAGVGIACG